MVERESSVDVPVRTIAIVRPNGEVRHSRNVFCPIERLSFEPKVCTRCERCASMPVSINAEGASLRCTAPQGTGHLPGQSWFVGADAAAGSVPVGAVVGRMSIGAHRTTPCKLACEVMDRYGVLAAVVVDGLDVVGIVLRSDLFEHPGVVSDVMSLVTRRVPESAPLSVAIAPMAYGRARAIAVVGDDGSFVGLLTELDVLHWIAREAASSIGDPGR